MGFFKPLPKMGALHFLFIATILGAATAAKDLLEVSAPTAGNMRRELASKKTSSKKSKAAPLSKTAQSKTRGSKATLGETTNTAVSMLTNEGKRTSIKLMANQVPSDFIPAC